MKNISFSKIWIVLFLFSFSFFNYSCKSDGDEEMEVRTEFSLMSVTLNGEEYTMLNNVETLFGFPETTRTLYGEVGDSIRYVWFQGDYPSFQINIRLTEEFWKEGTFTLIEGTFFDEVGAYVSFVDKSNYGYNFDIEGEITISKFDLVTKEFEGSFNFSNAENTANGTLIYPLDHPDL